MKTTQSEINLKYWSQNTPEVEARRERLRERMKIHNISVGRPKGTKNKKPYPKTDAVLQRYKNNPPPSWTGKQHTQEWKDNMSRATTERIRRNGPSGPFQGKFTPTKPEKYVGNVTNIVYRSSWERVFMVWLDNKDSVLQWGSEELIIDYFDPVTNRMRRYFPDFVFKVRNKTGEIKTYVVEIKPHEETYLRSQPSKQTKAFLSEAATYAKNTAKWNAARAFCSQNGWEFRIITEYDLGLKKRPVTHK